MAFVQHFFSYFPQFNPDPINDRAWGKGFTDWDLIRALPEPQRDSFTPQLGYYDPSNSEYLNTLKAQLESSPLPKAGLMVYHYHFDGVFALSGFEKQLLAHPNNAPPFFLCWANESWSKRWIGLPGEILIEQKHKADAELIEAHVSHLLQFFKLDQYHTVDGRPLFMIYDSQVSLALPRVLAMYREFFKKSGYDPLIGVCVGYPQPSTQLNAYDFVCEFQPRFFFNSKSSSVLTETAARLKVRMPKLFEWIGGQRDRLRGFEGRRSFSYADYLMALENGQMESALRSIAGKLPLMRSAFLRWDNSPRYGDRGTRVDHASVAPASLSVLDKLRSDDGLPLLINSWNEWSEGAALEPGLLEHSLRADFFQALGKFPTL
ncbi:MAG: hypothetical protein DCF26_09050 [Burkholderiales bacterium]|nr:MAG: hypothetical protein DCF26_09050 [Burkholderiales bacterium]